MPDRRLIAAAGPRSRPGMGTRGSQAGPVARRCPQQAPWRSPPRRTPRPDRGPRRTPVATSVGLDRPIGSRTSGASAAPGRPSATTRPASRTTVRSVAARTAGSCSATRTATPVAASSRRIPATIAVPSGSSWAVGSSRTRAPVPIATMLAIATRCCSPPESANGSRSARWPMPSRSRVASIRASICSRGTPRFSSPNASSSRTVSFDADSWLAGVANTIPTRPRSLPGSAVAASTPPTVTVPPTRARTTRGMKPAAARASVDLPAPVRPAIPTIEPPATSSDTPSRAGSRRPG